MYMKVFPHGQGTGEGPTRYLVRPDYPGRDECPPEVLRGDVETTCDLIDSLETKWKFTAGVLSWHPNDTVTPEQEQRLMDDFEHMAFAGMEPDQRNILWVRHVHADHHELHFIIPRVELSGGKAFNACPPGWQKHFDVLRDLHNVREGWARPDDPARARLFTPERANLHNARLIRWGKPSKKDERAEAKEAIHNYLQELIEQGRIRQRQDVILALLEAGLEINRTGKNYITVKDPESCEKLRLKGGMYAEQFELTDRKITLQNRKRKAGCGSPDPEELRRLKSEFERIVEKRAEYNRGRYPRKPFEHGAEHQLTLPEFESPVQRTVSHGFALELRHSAADHALGLGADYAGSISYWELETGDCGTIHSESDSGRGLQQTMEPVQRSGAVQSGRQGLHADTQGLADRVCGKGQSEGRLGSCEEVSHDRTGTYSERNAAFSGTGFDRHAGEPRQKYVWPTTSLGRTKPKPSGAISGDTAFEGPTTGIRAALAALELRTRELATCTDALEQLIERQVKKVYKQEKSTTPKLRLGR